METTLTVKEILSKKGEDLNLTVVAGEKGLTNRVLVSALNHPGPALAGFFEVFAHKRIQVIGLTELSFFLSLDAKLRKERLEKICRSGIPCLVVTTDQMIPDEILELGNSCSIPILKTSFETTRFTSLLSAYLEQEFAPSCTMHGTMMEIFGMGVLLIGKSGVGKSECSLELVQRGHRLIADDMVVLSSIGKDTILASAPKILGYHMEIRGIGIIDVKSLFGIGAVKNSQKVDMVITLERWKENKLYEREGLEQTYFTILDIRIPEYTLPVEPGRNLSILVETAALHRRLLSTGVIPAKQLNNRVIELMKQQGKAADTKDPEDERQADK